VQQPVERDRLDQPAPWIRNTVEERANWLASRVASHGDVVFTDPMEIVAFF
jgi:hypothetical protein